MKKCFQNSDKILWQIYKNFLKISVKPNFMKTLTKFRQTSQKYEAFLMKTLMKFYENFEEISVKRYRNFIKIFSSSY